MAAQRGTTAPRLRRAPIKPSAKEDAVLGPATAMSLDPVSLTDTHGVLAGSLQQRVARACGTSLIRFRPGNAS